MTSAVFIDTCIWVDYFRGHNHALCDAVDTLILDRQACCNGMVLAELLYGVRGESEKQIIATALRALTIFSDDPDMCTQAGILGATLRKNGLTIPVTDCLIAAQCLKHDLPLLSHDRHFDSITAYFPLRRFPTIGTTDKSPKTARGDARPPT